MVLVGLFMFGFVVLRMCEYGVMGCGVVSFVFD